MVKENIVIVGSGGAGVLLASQLSSRVDSSKHNIVLISPGGRHFVMPSLIRMVVTDDGHLEERAALPLSEMLTGRVEVKIGKVVGIEDDGELGTGGSVTLESGEQVSYKVLVLATGSSFEGPLAFPDAYADVLDYVKQWRSKFAKANHVAIVGAGSVGLGEFRNIEVVLSKQCRLMFLCRVCRRDQRLLSCKRFDSSNVLFCIDVFAEHQDHSYPCRCPAAK